MAYQRKTDVRTMFGHCFSATLLSAGSLRSSTSSEAFHAKCPGVLAHSGRPGMRCECPCHSVVRESTVVETAAADAGATTTATAHKTTTATAATATINRKRGRGNPK